MQNVHDHMRARKELLGHPPFWGVQRGWKKGVYTSREEAERQIRNFPGPRMKEFQDIDEALAYVHGPPEEAPSTWHSPFDDDEAAVGLGPGTESNLKAAKAAQTAQMKKEPMAGLAPGVAAGPGTGAQSQTPPAVDQLPALPLSPTRAQGTRSPTRPQGATSPKRAPPNSPYTSSPSSQQPSVPSSSVRIQSAMPILQVKSLRASLSFYATVLGFHIIAQHGNAHAVLTSFTSGRGSNAGICLRAEDQMPAGPSGSGAGGLSRSASLNRSGAAGGISRAGSLRRPAPATPARVQPAVSTSESSAAGAASEIPPSSGSGSGGLRRANSVATRSARAAPPPPPPPRISASSASTTGGGPALSGICVLLEISGSLESLRATFDNAMSTWVKEAREAAESGEGLPEARRWDGARVVGEIEEKPWATRELSIIDPDGHRLIFSEPIDLPSPASALQKLTLSLPKEREKSSTSTSTSTSKSGSALTSGKLQSPVAATPLSEKSCLGRGCKSAREVE